MTPPYSRFARQPPTKRCQADRELGRLDMYSDCMPDIELFIRMHVLKEPMQ
jgi:hypothetical protein